MTYYLTPYQKRKERLFFNDIFDDLFSIGFHGGTTAAPDERINESDSCISLSIEVPGFEKSDIHIDYKENQLFIHASSSDDANQRNDIKRRYTIENIDIKKSTAELKNGILTLSLEKTATSKPQQLKIS